MSTIVESFQKRSFFPSPPLKDELPISQLQTNPSPAAGQDKKKMMMMMSSLSTAAESFQIKRSISGRSFLTSPAPQHKPQEDLPISQHQTKPTSPPNNIGQEEIKKTTSSSILESIQKRSFFPSSKPLLLNNKEQDLPISQKTSQQASKVDQSSLRRRLSSSSFSNLTNIQTTISSATSSWAVFNRSKSMSSMAGDEFAGISTSITKWWAWGLAWILSRKPTFATDLEMNDEESAVLGFHNRGSWRHVIYKVRSEFTRIVKGSDNATTVLDHAPI